MKKFLLLLCLCAPLLSFGADVEVVDDDDAPDPEVFEQRMEKMIIKRAKLSEKEAAQFSVIYKDFQKKQRTTGKEIFELKDDTYDSPKAYADAITKIRNLEVQLATNVQNYTMKLLKVLPAKKVFRIMKVEDDFRRRLVKGNQEPNPNDGKMQQRDRDRERDRERDQFED